MRDTDYSDPGQGLKRIEAEFVTEHLVIRGELSTPEGRLSDHLNSSTTSLEIRPFTVRRIFSGDSIDLSGAHAHITKAHLLFIVPVTEPDQDANNTAWARKMTRKCWAVLGRYSVTGKIHADLLRDPRLILRGLEQKQFLPLTEATITTPDGVEQPYPALIVNRSHLEMVALRNIE